MASKLELVGVVRNEWWDIETEEGFRKLPESQTDTFLYFIDNERVLF